jgi:hypothetical protein
MTSVTNVITIVGFLAVADPVSPGGVSKLFLFFKSGSDYT